MSKMLRKKLIPAELMVASSLLLVPGFTLTGYGQNSPQTSPPASRPQQPLRRQHTAAAPPALRSATPTRLPPTRRRKCPG